MLRCRRFIGKEISWNILNTSRVVIVTLLGLVKFLQILDNYIKLGIDVASNSSTRHVIVLSTLMAPNMQFFGYIILLKIYLSHRAKGLHTSGPVWVYLFVSIICESVNYYQVVDSLQETVRYETLLDTIVDLIHFPLVVILFLLDCYGDTPNLSPDPTDSANDTRPDSPELVASFFSSLTFWWYNKFLIFGYKNKLELANLWKSLPRDRTSNLIPTWKKIWTKYASGKRNLALDKPYSSYQSASGQRQGYNNIIFVLARFFYGRVLGAALLKLIQDILQYTAPMVLKLLLRFMSSKTAPQWQGVFYAVLLLIIPSVQSVILGAYFYVMQVIGNQARNLIMGSVYRKAMLLGGNSRQQSTSGEMVNLIAVDSYRFQELALYMHLLWSAPFQIIIAVYLIYCELGWAVFAGLFIMTMLLPINAFVARYVKKAQLRIMKVKDERVKQVGEMLGGIRVIKLYAWENSFISNLFGFRNKELAQLKKCQQADASMVFLWNSTPFLVAITTFAVYVLSDEQHSLTPEKAFVSISLFNLLRFPLSMLPNLVSNVVLTSVSAKRLNKFLNSDELSTYVTRNDELEAISVEGGCASWSAELGQSISESGQIAASAVLKDIDLHIKRGSFVAIVGQVASGKSSLLAAILGEMHRISGRFNVCKNLSLAYVPQQAWIQNMTVRDNILFGHEYDEQLYDSVVAACSLRADLETLPGGDDAEIGEKGINMSGGQKQRVSLARACYSKSDVYLLDDPLSALDSHVGKHVYNEILSSKTGMLRDKTRVLATNSLFVLPQTDFVYVLKDGRIVESGRYQDLMANNSGYLAEVMQQHWANNSSSDQQKPPASDHEQLVASEAPLGSASSPTRQAAKTTKSAESAETGAKEADILATTKTKTTKTKASRLIDVERVEMGSVNYRIYLSYFRAASYKCMLFLIVMFISAAAFNVATNVWLSIWSEDAAGPTDAANDKQLKNQRLTVYTILGIFNCVSVYLGSIGFAWGAVRASKRIHANLLDGVMHSPMIFFDTTPIGRIVNRFAKDIDVVDLTIPGSLRSCLSCLLQVISTVFIISYSFPKFVLLVVPLAVVYYLIQRVFIVTTRQLKRLESITRSPIYSHFGETLSGLSSIRAYGKTDSFISQSDTLIDRNQSCSYPNLIANRWLSLRLELFGNLITAAAAMFSIYSKGVIGASVAGLTVSFSLNITQTLSWLIRMISDLETNIVSVERIVEYANNKREDLWVKEARPSDDWPKQGAISFQDYSARYRENTDLVLTKISINIKPGEKVGIVGRTGSGKSSLSLSLFRILEASSGKILIDGEDVAQYGLHDLRSRLTIIPQDPVLFSGTLRFNLDPLKLYSDLRIWQALELAHLKANIASLPNGLDHIVSEYGENFSVGQRQLICLARAILRKSQIFVLDEATASVDLETDSVVQKTIRQVFRDCTIITIAHRIHTILDSDRILVLERGEVRELDTPQRLMASKESAFSLLLDDAGLTSSSDNVDNKQAS